MGGSDYDWGIVCVCGCNGPSIRSPSIELPKTYKPGKWRPNLISLIEVNVARRKGGTTRASLPIGIVMR